jgi:hypothetical protein
MPFIVPERRIEDMAYHIEVFGERAEHLKPVLEDITDKILERERHMFETHGASSGVYWAPLKATTILRKGGGTAKRRGGRITSTGGAPAFEAIPFPERPLWRFGELMLSLSERGAKYQHLTVDDEGIDLRTDHPSASYHTTGTRRMPARPPLVIPKKHAEEYTKDINDFIFGERHE